MVGRSNRSVLVLVGTKDERRRTLSSTRKSERMSTERIYKLRRTSTTRTFTCMDFIPTLISHVSGNVKSTLRSSKHLKGDQNLQLIVVYVSTHCPFTTFIDNEYFELLIFTLHGTMLFY